MAQQVCVECREPERTYRCTIKDGERVQSVRGINHAFEFLCISEISRAAGHKSCRVGTGFSGPCIGQPFEVDVSRPAGDNPGAGRAPAASSEARLDTPVSPPAPGAPPAAPASKPPETLEQLARETVAKSKEQISAADEQMRKAGDAVGGAVRKTWDCVTSLFSRC